MAFQGSDKESQVTQPKVDQIQSRDQVVPGH